ncbi:S8 family serine peptidase [Pseudomonadota bacterium]
MTSAYCCTRFAALIAALTLAWVPTNQAADSEVVPSVLPDRKISARVQTLIDKAEREGPQRVIVGLDSGFVPEGRLKAVAAASQRRRISNIQTSVMTSLSGLAAVERRRFRHIPFMVLEAGAPALKRLATSSMVLSLVEDRAERPIMSSSNAVIGSPDAWAAGYEGSGWTVAILDTGVDKTHPFFATRSKVVSEACYSTTLQSQKSSSVCPDGVSASVLPGSGLNCPLEVEGCTHGTHVAGSVAGDDQMGPNFGVARSSGIIAIQVFSSFDSVGTCRGPSTTPCALAYVSDQVAGLERVYDLRNDFNIAAVNMSLGGAAYSDPVECDANEEMRKAAIDTLRSVGIATVVASGNSGSRDTVSTPACISSAVSVGSTTDGDAVSSFSNVADFLDLLAPGSSITSSVPGGGTSTWNGTSMATPHVAGAWAVLKQKSPAADVESILGAFRDTGTSVDDSRSNGTVTDMRRINVNLALNAFGPPLPEYDSTPAGGAIFDFGEVPVETAADALELQVRNLGNAELTLACSIEGENPAAFFISECPPTLAMNQTATVSFVCQPQQPSPHTALLYLDTNDPDEARVSYQLDCQGTAPEFESIPTAGSEIDFGLVPVTAVSESEAIQVQNLGNAALLINCSLTGDDVASFIISGCPPSLDPLVNANIDLHCDPGSVGSKSAALELATNDADEADLSFNLACFGTAPEFDSTPAPGSDLDFGEVLSGTMSDTLMVQVDNLGDAELTVECAVSGEDAALFEIVQCPETVGETADQVLVNCQPLEPGEFLASLDLLTNDDDESELSYGLICTGQTDALFIDGFEPQEGD